MINIEDYIVTRVDYRRLYDENKTGDSPIFETFRTRVEQCGWDLERALYTPIIKKLKDDDGYNKWLPVAIENGISVKTFEGRMYNCVFKGTMTYEEAATRPLYKSNNSSSSLEQVIFNKLTDEKFGYATLSKKEKQYVKEHPEQFKEWL